MNSDFKLSNPEHFFFLSYFLSDEVVLKSDLKYRR